VPEDALLRSLHQIPNFHSIPFLSISSEEEKISVSFVGIVSMDDYTGRQIGHYRILRQLGTGAFATVYLAEHLYIEKLAAIKILHIAINAQSYRQYALGVMVYE